MTKLEVKEKAAAIINNVEDHDMSKDVLLVKDLLGENQKGLRYNSEEFDWKINYNYLARRYAVDLMLNKSLAQATINYDIHVCKKLVALFGNLTWATLNAENCVVELRKYCAENANDKETEELKLASSFGTFKGSFKLLKHISRYLNKFYQVKDVFADVKLSDYPAPKQLSEYQDIKNARTEETNVDDVLYFTEQSYLKGINNRPADIKDLWHQQLLVTIEMFKKTGVRKGELLALTWDDLKLVENGNRKFATLSISKSFSRNTQILSKPKTAKGVRIIPLTFDFYERLMAYKEIQVETDLMFPNSLGKYDTRDRFGKALRAGNKEVHGDNKSKYLTVHGIRHYYATKFLKENQGSLDDLSVLLGHTDTTTTIRNYVDNRDIPADRLADIADRVGA
jgi:integrase